METQTQSFDIRLLPQYIDHTLLRPQATEVEVKNFLEEARAYQFYGVCLEKDWVPVARESLQGTEVQVITVIDFPHGNAPLAEKCKEVERACELGAHELDIVLNRELLKSKRYEALYGELHQVVLAANGVPIKVILETSELNHRELWVACGLCKAAGAQFVKTSTGFSSGGARLEDVQQMRAVVGEDMGVKASGGIRSLQDALAMLNAGANRLGLSASVNVMEQAKQCLGGKV